jgi:hypothetical protein
MLVGEVIAKKLSGRSNEEFAIDGGVGLGEATIGVVAGEGDVLGVGELLGGCLEFDKKIVPKVIAATVKTNDAITANVLIRLLIFFSSSD